MSNRELAIDGPCPVNTQCMRMSWHEPPHHCVHGFHWTDKREDFKGTAPVAIEDTWAAGTDGAEGVAGGVGSCVRGD